MLIFWGQFGAKMKKSPSQIPKRAIKVIRLGFEPKTHSLEGCCSIQLSYRTSPFLPVSEADAESGCKDRLNLRKVKILGKKTVARRLLVFIFPCLDVSALVDPDEF